MTFLNVLQLIKKTTLEVNEHSNIPFTKIATELNPKKMETSILFFKLC